MGYDRNNRNDFSGYNPRRGCSCQTWVVLTLWIALLLGFGLLIGVAAGEVLARVSEALLTRVPPTGVSLP